MDLWVPTSRLDRADERRPDPAWVERMWAAGLLEEARALDAAGLRAGPGRTARRAIGYAQALGELDGEMTKAEAVASTDEELCGHRNMSGRTCTREKGHAAKSHRYS